MTPIYLDNNATTPIHPEVAAAMDACQRSGLANPASSHAAGRRARRVLEQARAGIAAILGARTTGMAADRLLFTSGGTEANNLAVRGLTRGRPGRLIVSALEHASLAAAAEHAAVRGGHELIRLPADPRGVTQLADLPGLLQERTRLVSIMLGNNETGVVQPVADAAVICRRVGVPLHTDAVQAIGKVAVRFAELGVDALSISAHKFHGPVGIGALLVRHDLPVEPILFGGFQQAGLRPGTEPIALVVGMHRALQLWEQERDARPRRLRELRDTFERRLKAAVSGIVIHGADAPRLPQTSCVAFPGLDRQALVMALDRQHIACSTGSACASGSSEASPVLRAMCLPDTLVEGSVRFSISTLTTDREIVQAVDRISSVVQDLRKQRFSGCRAASPPNSWSPPV